jgi:GTP-binding protein
MSSALSATFVAAVVRADELPPSAAEIAFLGRSNVGKSSLLNALVGQKLAFVSSSPGRTQVLACFALVPHGTLVDCPGYGYAKVSKQQRRDWPAMIEDYLRSREALRKALLLVDGEVGPTASDLYMLDWLRENDVPHAVVATKRDKVRPSQRANRAKEIAAKCELEVGDVTHVSLDDARGLAGLRDLVRSWLA